jgi:hypothetical protein
VPPRRPRHVRTRRTQVWLSEDGHALVRVWATAQGLSFSAGLEALARLGLRQAPAAALGPAVGRAAARTVRAEVGALRALLAATALDAAQTRRLATAILRHLPPPGRPDPRWAAQTRAWAQLARRDAVDALAAGDALAELGLAEDDAADGPAPWEADAGAEDREDREEQDGDPLGLFGDEPDVTGAAG